MSKRKYADFRQGQNGRPNGSESKLYTQNGHIDSLLDLGKRTIFQSLKVARGFERQKLGRRQKAAKSAKIEADIKRHETEIQALKDLDLSKTAETHLYKSLLKSKPIASAPGFPLHVQATIEAHRHPQSAASANVQARLFKSSPVHTAMADAIKNIRGVLGIDEVKEAKLGAKKRLRAKDFANGHDQPSNLGLADVKAKGGEERVVHENHLDSKPAKQEWEEDPWDGFSSCGDAHDDSKASQNSDGSVAYTQYASRLAGSSEEDFESDFGDHYGMDVQGPSLVDISQSAEEEISDEETIPLKPARTARSSITVPKATTFLPSLAMGGYWSGSEPMSDEEGENAAMIETRKNRKGQQARRALWEKKFGKNANHIKKQEQSRDHGWDARRGASGNDDRGQRGRGRGGKTRGKVSGLLPRQGGESGRPKHSSGANSDPVGLRKAKPSAEGPLHPSWEAAKKAKELKKAAAFQGKKVVFD